MLVKIKTGNFRPVFLGIVSANKNGEAKMGEINIRKATAEDAGLILGFIKELAKFEKMERGGCVRREQARSICGSGLWGNGRRNG